MTTKENQLGEIDRMIIATLMRDRPLYHRGVALSGETYHDEETRTWVARLDTMREIRQLIEEKA